MAALPALTARKVLHALQHAGFREHHTTGSHVHLRRADKPGLHVVAPYHNRDLAPKTLRSIIAQAGLTVDEFLAYV